MEEDRLQNRSVKYTIYLLIWAYLLILPGMTVTVSRMHLGNLGTLTSLVIATVKATLVLLFFMHLRYESRFFRMVFIIPIMTLAVIIGLTFFDISFR